MIAAVTTGFYNALKLWPEAWVLNTAYTVGDVIKPTTPNTHSYQCTTAGTSGGTEPTWGTTNGGTTSDGTVTWTCYDLKTYNVIAPQDSVAPYVTFGLMTGITKGTFASFKKIEDITFWVNCYSSISTAAVAEVADEVMAAVDNASLTVSGYTAMKCVREYMGYAMWDEKTGIYMIPMRYRVWITA